MAPHPHPTLLRPPPPDPAKSPIENDLEIIAMTVLGPDIFTNARPSWHPPGARGIYGGTVVAMSLAAGQRTVEPDFALHSCHCYFLLAGNGDIPILFHVERVRDGRSFATRTVQARQRGRCIFTVTMSFVRQPAGAGAPEAVAEKEQARLHGSAVAALTPPPSSVPTPSAANEVRHAAELPADRPPIPPPGYADGSNADDKIYERYNAAFNSHQQDKDGKENKNPFTPQPVQAGPIRIVGADTDVPPHLKKTQQWIRVRGTISPAGGRAAHLNALAYLSDRYFIGTICRLHRLWRFPFSVAELLGEDEELGGGMFEGNPELAQVVREYVEFEGGGVPLEAYRGRPAIGMVVSLDHTIYFHNPDRVRADEWMLAEMESPWAGAGRGVVAQRIFAADGTLLATCVQEGIVRLKEPEEEKKKAAKSKI